MILVRLLIIATIVHHLGAMQTTCIIIPGTWSAYSSWHKPEGDFFCALQKSEYAQNINIVQFTWSGKNNNRSRLEAAKELVLYMQSLDPSTHIIIIAHSHGANVAILASQLMGQKNHNTRIIERLYTLGAPVCTSAYHPNMQIIQRLYHFFSFNDIIQPVFGIFDRQFPSHERIANIRLLIDGKEPHHSGLRCPLIARWCLAIHEKLSKQHIGNFEHFKFEIPGILHLFSDKPPLYAHDFGRAHDTHRDRKNLNRLRKKITRHHQEMTAHAI